MKPMPEWLVLACRAALIVLIPVVVVLTNVRLLMTPLFPAYEYNRPGFPADPYGFTLEDRLRWANIAINYLLNDAGIEFLGDLRFPDGQAAPPESCPYYTTRDCTYLYNDRELRHMRDVKNVTRAALRVWAVSGLACLLAAGALYYSGERSALRAGLLGGAGLTAAILAAVVVYVLVNFNALFVQFHRVFFEGDTWLFLWSDTLIRLFPLPFWQDAFLFIGGGAIVQSALIGALAWWGLK